MHRNPNGSLSTAFSRASDPTRITSILRLAFGTNARVVRLVRLLVHALIMATQDTLLALNKDDIT
jgi:hypothetical protein